MPDKSQLSDNGFTLQEARELADYMSIDFSKVDYTLEEFYEGIKEELEHKDVTEGADVPTAKIALAHLKEDENYYSKLDEAMGKGIVGLPEDIIDGHEYSYKEGNDGTSVYWYVDKPTGNFYKYTNAPKESPDFNPYLGEAVLVQKQPLPHTHPNFFTKEEGLKRAMAVPEETQVEKNEQYDSNSRENIWFERYINADTNEERFTYLDSDVKQNLDLWVQYKLRVVDVSINTFRSKAVELFSNPHPKDRMLGAIMFLVDQGMFNPEELCTATVSDLEFIDQSVILLGRRFIPDLTLLDFFTSLKVSRADTDPLFYLDTAFGKRPLGIRHILALFDGLNIDTSFLFYWHVNHILSRILHRLHLEGFSSKIALERALQELEAIVYQTGSIEDFIDFKLLDTIMSNWDDAPVEGDTADAEDTDEEVSKALPGLSSLAVLSIFSSLEDKRSDEAEFSEWLHQQPWHLVTQEVS